jgi:hypothetical protein
MLKRLGNYFNKKGFVVSDYLVWIVVGVGIIFFAIVLFFIFNQSSDSLFFELAKKFRFGGLG